MGGNKNADAPVDLSMEDNDNISALSNTPKEDLIRLLQEKANIFTNNKGSAPESFKELYSKNSDNESSQSTGSSVFISSSSSVESIMAQNAASSR